ncbi:MAG TPA: PQQ-binding-like beta-propeller repeat protein [Gemmataceae bacterium]|jgi:outer membrane protein assembly factor BamB|nr:PQQ-binding-like beta-propeller repeat protein [Gemmataceae bacterium]
MSEQRTIAVRARSASKGENGPPRRIFIGDLALACASGSFAIVLFFAATAHASAQGPWSTYRGNSQRTGCTDDIPAPDAPTVAWVVKSKEHFVASPVPAPGDRLLVSGLGAFNTPSFACLSSDPKTTKRTIWSKGVPTFKLPTVSSPAVVGGKLIFGDGMHQTDGAILHCVELEDGKSVWKYDLPGILVHLEGSPTVIGDKIWFGGGSAGVLCLDAAKLTFQGKPMPAAEIRKQVDAQWKKLQAAYEDDKKKNPDFAIPPSEDQLPYGQPSLVWQVGKEKWHVDAPVAVAGGKVLVATAFLDKEQLGERAIYALEADTGKTAWKKALKLNPWGGPSVVGDTVIVTGSTINYDPAKLKGAKGSIAAFRLKDGTELWSKEVPGGVLACAALSGGVAVVAATDGKVRAFDVETGERKWIYEAKMALFAPVAIAKNRVYAGDLKGTIHAIDLTTGAGIWKLDLGSNAETKAPGMVYGGPIVSAGRVVVATCNLEGPHARAETVVVGIGAK